MAKKKLKKAVTKKGKTPAKGPAGRARGATRAKKAVAKKSLAKKGSSPAKKSRGRAKKGSGPAKKSPAASVAKKSAAGPAKKSPAAGRAKAAPGRKPGSSPLRREDHPGHLDPRYVAELRKQSGPRSYEPRAFLDGPRSPKDDLAEELGEEVIAKATTGEDDGEDALDQVVPEEQGGPFVQTNASQEFASGTDASNPKGAKREPFPRT
jgi:hypothetical protein